MLAPSHFPCRLFGGVDARKHTRAPCHCGSQRDAATLGLVAESAARCEAGAQRGGGESLCASCGGEAATGEPCGLGCVVVSPSRPRSWLCRVLDVGRHMVRARRLPRRGVRSHGALVAGQGAPSAPSLCDRGCADRRHGRRDPQCQGAFASIDRHGDRRGRGHVRGITRRCIRDPRLSARGVQDSFGRDGSDSAPRRQHLRRQEHRRAARRSSGSAAVPICSCSTRDDRSRRGPGPWQPANTS
jgi:hypothetical protein